MRKKNAAQLFKCSWQAAAAALFIALPVSFLFPDSGIGVSSEKSSPTIPRRIIADVWSLSWPPSVDGLSVGFRGGYFLALSSSLVPNPKPPLPPPHYSWTWYETSHWNGPLFYGVGFGTYSFGSPFQAVWTSRTGLIVPFWPLSLAAGAWLTYQFLQSHCLKRQIATGLCPTCRYDLRAHQSGEAGDKCPECGTPIAQPKAAKPRN